MGQFVALSAAFLLGSASVLIAEAQAPHGRYDPVAIEFTLVLGPHGGGYYAPEDAIGIHGSLTKRLWINGTQAVGATISAQSGSWGRSVMIAI